MTLDKKLQKIEAILKEYDKVLVALSGGVDSAFLLAFARKTLGADNVSAITACGPHLAKDEVEYAAGLCRDLGVEHEILNMDHVLPIIEHNPPDRCYLCKKEIFSLMNEKAAASGKALADGTNLDDMDDYRPGHKALNELNVKSPLKDSGMTKNDIRAALQMLAEEPTYTSDDAPYYKSALTLKTGMPIWEKPALACLASRIPYGESITVEKLSSIYKAETFLRDLGFTQVRVRHHGDIARLEVLPEDRCKFFDEEFMDMVNDHIKGLGFKYTVLDLGGYSMGGGYHVR